MLPGAGYSEADVAAFLSAAEAADMGMLEIAWEIAREWQLCVDVPECEGRGAVDWRGYQRGMSRGSASGPSTLFTKSWQVGERELDNMKVLQGRGE